MSIVTVTTEQVHELIQQLAAMTSAASITPEIVANILENLRQLNDQEKEKVIAIAEAYIAEIQNTGNPNVKSSDSEADIDVSDAQGNVIGRFAEGHIKTKNFDSSADATPTSRGLMSAADKEKLNSVERGAGKSGAKIADGDSDLDFSDENGNVVFRINGGDLETKNFNSKKINFILSFLQCQVWRVAHFSYDDVYSCLKRLTANKPASIYDDQFFADLKDLHDTYGIVVTLNTFNTKDGDAVYDISNVPNTYQQEFQAAKSWLKFSFHSESDVVFYDTATLASFTQSYQKWLTAIYKLTGDYGCIDRQVRLGSYKGTLENVLAMKGFNYGCKIISAPDDNRKGYYCSQEQTNLINSNGKWLDVKNELVFLKTMPRLEGGLESLKNAIVRNPKYQQYTEMFTHEYAHNKANMVLLCEWLQENGFQWAFLSDIINY